MYVSAKFKTKKSLKDAVKSGDEVYAISNSLFPESGTGQATLSMPVDYHKWYAQIVIENYKIVSVK
tara:strand:+ start:595 stop:792 length:198 start_codon:yes stop_codon:yes gene_type:complete